MKALRRFTWLSFVYLITGCASLQVGGEFLTGRQALLRGNDEAALGYFQSVAQKDPDYVFGSAYRQSVLSYLGRTQYSTGKLPEARRTLERALAAKQTEEDLARLYLGLTMVRSGDRASGLKELESGMKGISEWLDYVNEAHRFSFGQFWDPGRDIRSAIESQLAMFSSRDIDSQKIIAEGEWLGKRMEEEVDRAQKHESMERSRPGEDASGDPQP